MKKIKTAIARFFWRFFWRDKTPKRRFVSTATVFMFGVVTGSYGFASSIVTGDGRISFSPWLLLIGIAGFVIVYLVSKAMIWRRDLPECKIVDAENLLKAYPPSVFKIGTELVERAKLTGRTDQLESWMKAFREYEAAVNELRILKRQAVDIPSQIRQLKRKTADLRQSLDLTA